MGFRASLNIPRWLAFFSPGGFKIYIKEQLVQSRQTSSRTPEFLDA